MSTPQPRCGTLPEGPVTTDLAASGSSNGLPAPKMTWVFKTLCLSILLAGKQWSPQWIVLIPSIILSNINVIYGMGQWYGMWRNYRTELEDYESTESYCTHLFDNFQIPRKLGKIKKNVYRILVCSIVLVGPMVLQHSFIIVMVFPLIYIYIYIIFAFGSKIVCSIITVVDSRCIVQCTYGGMYVPVVIAADKFIEQKWHSNSL